MSAGIERAERIAGIIAIVGLAILIWVVAVAIAMDVFRGISP